MNLPSTMTVLESLSSTTKKFFGIFQTLEVLDRSENTGIGLAIVKKVVKFQGGTISLES